MGGQQALIDARLRSEAQAQGLEYVENDTVRSQPLTYTLPSTFLDFLSRVSNFLPPTQEESRAGLVSHHILRDTVGYAHTHHVLATVSLATGPVTDRIALHYRAPGLQPVSLPTEITMDQLELLSGLQSLGAVSIPVAHAALAETAGQYVFGLADPGDLVAEGVSAEYYEDQVLRAVEAALGKGSGKGEGKEEDGVPFSVYRLPVLGRLEGCLVRATATIRLWNWKKPGSPYRREGSWTEDLKDLLAGAETSAGNNLQLLLMGANYMNELNAQAQTIPAPPERVPDTPPPSYEQHHFTR